MDIIIKFEYCYGLHLVIRANDLPEHVMFVGVCVCAAVVAFNLDIITSSCYTRMTLLLPQHNTTIITNNLRHDTITDILLLLLLLYFIVFSQFFISGAFHSPLHPASLPVLLPAGRTDRISNEPRFFILLAAACYKFWLGIIMNGKYCTKYL